MEYSSRLIHFYELKLPQKDGYTNEEVLLKSIGKFDEFSIQAEDTDKNYKLELFDLVSNRIKSVVNVQKRSKSRSIISADMFEKLESEIIKNQL